VYFFSWPNLRIGLAVLCFLLLQNRFFGPHTAKSQPIWIKFCTHLLLYGTHLWVDLDRDRRVGGSKPNQNDYVFVILVTHHKSYIERTVRRDFGGKPSEWRCGRVLSWKIPEFYSVGGAISKNSIFFAFGGTLRLSCAQPTGNSFTPNQWYRWKAETLKVCLLLICRVCDQAFGRCPWMVPKSGHVTITKIENLHKDTRRKMHWFQKCCFFRSTAKNNEVIAENRFRTVASPGACECLPSWIYARRQYLLLVLF